MNDRRTRWLALYALCLGDLMIVLDTNIVNVALPSIQTDLGFSPEALAWVVNAYMLTFGGFLLLSGRLGDLYGNRRVLLGGVASFTAASVACAFAPSATFLVVGRAVQGLGGAAVSAVALALIMGLFTDPGERAKAMGVFGFVMSGGGAVGVLLGGVLTGLLTWHWIFLVNVPIGFAVWLLVTRLIPADAGQADGSRLDVTGAALVTVALMLAVYGVVGGNEAGWTSTRTLGILAGAVALLVAFVVREARVEHPLVPLRLFTLRNVAVSQVVGVLWAGAMFACFFLTALYMQGVLGYDALEVGLAYLPSCLVMAVMSVSVSDRLVMRFGIRPPLTVGLALVAASLALFAGVPVDGRYALHVLPGMVLLGLGAGIAFNPVLLAAMGDVEPHEAGLASGVVNTSFMMGGALGLAVLVSISSWRTSDLAAGGSAPLEALNGGYQLAFATGAVMAAAAAVVGGTLLRPKPMQAPEPDLEPALPAAA
ncbi:DHA2 family efflux MFS transporter permease subunit [Nocardioides guangzhouensis]|uniref:DHA2 family efflux MFS transporter permease subunit n=1 Tax=Nocardioides guangzhouensis TaxID=2497878 RepID=A0A4Q4Z9R5_9ACTN|nr:DHA2 family efflux MFS transporter permease subunit [Nocardioides guangzhouensis]RYP83926.1 DHA2 family efflux MFS transporter permease subunit [Nocardioides guangzhouensis]